jgi:hypothetical protein
MNDDSFFDPIDSELRRRFDAATPSTAADPDAVLDTLRPRMHQARTRRRAALGGMAAGVVAVVAVAGFALSDGTTNPNVNTPPATRSSEPEPTVTLPTIPTLPDGSEVKEFGTNGGGTFNGGTAADSGSDSSNGGSGSSGESGGGTPTPTTVPAPSQQSYSSSGGSITVQFVNGQVSLVSSNPVAGATAEVHDNGPTRVEVRFFDSSGEISRIRVEVVDGALVRTT